MWIRLLPHRVVVMGGLAMSLVVGWGVTGGFAADARTLVGKNEAATME